jgi:hypothetical protein
MLFWPTELFRYCKHTHNRHTNPSAGFEILPPTEKCNNGWNNQVAKQHHDYKQQESKAWFCGFQAIVPIPKLTHGFLNEINRLVTCAPAPFQMPSHVQP